jgi:hypothetical protein
VVTAQPGYYIAQCNVSRLLAPLDSPQIAPFVAELDRINALAEATPGFIWRLKTPAGDATAIRVFDDDMIIVNMSVWDSIEALYAFTYRTDHTNVLRQRKDWFEAHKGPALALWWIPAQGPMPAPGDIPPRLEHLAKHGPTMTAFTFKDPFAAPAVP